MHLGRDAVPTLPKAITQPILHTRYSILSRHFCTFAQAEGRFAHLHLGRHAVLSLPRCSYVVTRSRPYPCQVLAVSGWRLGAQIPPPGPRLFHSALYAVLNSVLLNCLPCQPCLSHFPDTPYSILNTLTPLLHLCTGRRPICTFAPRSARSADPASFCSTEPLGLRASNVRPLHPLPTGQLPS
jgi:hypothetical protein